MVAIGLRSNGFRETLTSFYFYFSNTLTIGALGGTWKRLIFCGVEARVVRGIYFEGPSEIPVEQCKRRGLTSFLERSRV